MSKMSFYLLQLYFICYANNQNCSNITHTQEQCQAEVAIWTG